MRTSHSEYGQIEALFLKSAKDAFISQEKINDEWQGLNYLDKPNFDNCISEYEQFVDLFDNDIELKYFPVDDACSLDVMYCRDASILTDHGAIICNMGKAARKPEPSSAEAFYIKNGIPILGRIASPGTLEGGDVCWLDHRTLAVAHGYRTNQSAFDQLCQLLKPFDIDLIQVELPHYKGQQDVFHLMSILSPVDEHKAVVYSPLMPIRFRNELLHRAYELIEVPDEEFESMGCNVLAVAPSKCLIMKGNPITTERLKAADCEVTAYYGHDISWKGGGGPTCLTRPYYRNI